MENKSQHSSSMPEDLTFTKLEEVTKFFSDEYKVGCGGYGEVYKVRSLLVVGYVFLQYLN